MKLKPLIGLTTCCTFLLGGASVASEIQLTLADCGGYTGFAGYITEHGITVTFESCETPTGSYTKFWDTAGSLMADIVYTEYPEDVAYFIANIDVSAELTEQDLDAIDDVVTSVEAPLVDALVPKLLQLGMNPKGKPMITLVANAVGFERKPEPLAAGDFCFTCRSHATSCLGCCGLGCWGCGDLGTVCSQRCYEHDLCVRQY